MTTDKGKTEYALALGFFDGLHLAHMSVINAAAAYRDKGLRPAVLLFDRHPRNVIGKENVPFLLEAEKRDRILSDMGIEAFTVSFEEIMNMSPEEFVKRILVEKIGAAAVSCGYNYRFGKNGEGSAELLGEICRKYGISVTVCPEFTLKGENISSTKIRRALINGETEEANEMLGFPFSFSSVVISGDKRGRLLGTPTVNQRFPEGLVVPASGVYASRVKVDSREYIAVTDIGFRPTFDGEDVRSETYILDFSGDLYGKTVEVFLYKYLREERKFPDAEQLIAQIGSDVQTVREYFSENRKKN